MRELNRNGGKRRFKTGQQVVCDGLYSDDWGDNLLLLQGDRFPSNPQMGHTHWTFAGPVYRMAGMPRRHDGSALDNESLRRS